MEKGGRWKTYCAPSVFLFREINWDKGFLKMKKNLYRFYKIRKKALKIKFCLELKKKIVQWG